MSLDLGLSLAAIGLLVVAAAARSLVWSGALAGQRRWNWPILALRTLVIASLGVALAVSLSNHAAWMPLSAWQIALAVSLAALVIDLALWAWYRLDGAGPAADLLAATLIAVGLGAGWPAGTALGCIQCTLPAQAQGILFLIGAGGAVVMGGTGLVLPFRRLALRRSTDPSFPARAELSSFMKAATMLTLVLLGTGLVVGIGWAWRALGRPVGEDLRWGWMAAAWLLSAISWLGWRLSQRGGAVVIAFALLALVAAAAGVLAAEPVPHLFAF